MSEKNLKWLKDRLDEVIGDDTEQAQDQRHDEMVLLRKKAATTKDVQDLAIANKTVIKELQSSVVGVLERVRESVEKSKPEIPDIQKVEIQNLVKPVTTVTVSNLKDLPAPVVTAPDTVDIKKGWLDKSLLMLIGTVSESIKALGDRVLRVKIVDSNDPAKPVSVRLSDGKRWYTALMTVAQKVGSVPFKTSSGEIKEALINDNGKLQVDIDMDSEGLATSAKQDDIIANTDKWETNAIDDYTTTNVTYICKEKADGTWWIKKISEAGDYPVFTHASALNNPTVTTYAAAFSARATTLVYGNYNEAF